MSGVMLLDETDTGGVTHWENAKQRCVNEGKQLPSIEVLKAVNDNGAQGGNRSFISNAYWSSTASVSGIAAYRQVFVNGNPISVGVNLNHRVRCAS